MKKVNDLSYFNTIPRGKEIDYNFFVKCDEKINQASFVEHLVELRSRLIRSIIYLFIFFIFFYFFAEHIYNFLVQPFADVVKEKGRLVRVGE